VASTFRIPESIIGDDVTRGLLEECRFAGVITSGRPKARQGHRALPEADECWAQREKVTSTRPERVSNPRTRAKKLTATLHTVFNPHIHRYGSCGVQTSNDFLQSRFQKLAPIWPRWTIEWFCLPSSISLSLTSGWRTSQTDQQTTPQNQWTNKIN
jgi:hypothetical protein